MRLCDEQREAVEAVEREGVLVITGGPGTGKTTTLKCILHLLDELGGAELCAPTGRAAKRMSEATGRPARTIHRLLEYAGEEGRFLRNEQEPLDCAAVVVDEMSMVDIFLFRALLRALRPGTRLVMVGDKDQLPSVGAGNVLKDILASGAVPSVTLTEVFRQAASSMIVRNAHRINRGEYPIVRTRDTDFFLERRESMRAAVDSVVQLVTTRLPRYLGVDPVRGIQVMAPMKRIGRGRLRPQRGAAAGHQPARPRQSASCAAARRSSARATRSCRSRTTTTWAGRAAWSTAWACSTATLAISPPPTPTPRN